MTRPRSQLVSLDATPYYHCISRCVRRAFLCGKDRLTGRSFDHRKPWLLERIAFLAKIFAIDVCAYAIMSNHYHLVLHVDANRAKAWSEDEVVARWTRLFKGPRYIQQWKSGAQLSEFERMVSLSHIKRFRDELANISKFMACLNQSIARRANIEDGCTGRFWEGRFKSQALLDEAALLSCMTYVDLNPIRAGIATDLADSDFTSIQDRIRQVQQLKPGKSDHKATHKRPRLLAFRERLKEGKDFVAIPYNLKDYLELADWTGRAVRDNKKGYIRAQRPKILTSLGISDDQWITLALDIQKQSILMLNGLECLVRIERRENKTAARAA
jgi:REP element-mobilizing transposase RayT